MFYRIRHKEGIGYFVLLGEQKSFMFFKWVEWSRLVYYNKAAVLLDKDSTSAVLDTLEKATKMIGEHATWSVLDKAEGTTVDYPHPITKEIAPK